jgi:hypothetical protein
LHQPEDEQQDTRGSQDGPGKVEVRESRAVPLIADQPDGRAEDGHAERREYEKGPAPASSLNEQTAEERTSRSEPCYRAPGAERLAPVGAIFERSRQDRQCGRKTHRGAKSLGEAGPDQGTRALGQPGGERRYREQGCPGEEHTATAEQVGRTTAQKHEPAEGEQVTAEDPLHVLHRHVQIAANRRKRDIGD